MRFCDLFISYKIGLKSIKNTVPFIKLPLYRKIAVIATFSISILSILLFMLKLYIPSYIVFGVNIISIVIFLIIDSRKNNLELMLKKHYSPYSRKRMAMVINILKEYSINVQNINTLNLLIEEAQKAQIQCDYLQPLKKPLKILGAIIFPIIAYVAEKIGDTASKREMVTMTASIIVVVLLIFSIIFSLTPILKWVLYREYNKYSELIYDLRQIKLFYAKEDSSSLS